MRRTDGSLDDHVSCIGDDTERADHGPAAIHENIVDGERHQRLVFDNQYAVPGQHDRGILDFIRASCCRPRGRIIDDRRERDGKGTSQTFRMPVQQDLAAQLLLDTGDNNSGAETLSIRRCGRRPTTFSPIKLDGPIFKAPA